MHALLQKERKRERERRKKLLLWKQDYDERWPFSSARKIWFCSEVRLMRDCKRPTNIYKEEEKKSKLVAYCFCLVHYRARFCLFVACVSTWPIARFVQQHTMRAKTSYTKTRLAPSKLAICAGV